MKIEARTKNTDRLSNLTKNKKCIILDYRGDEENGEYLIEVGKFPALRIWTAAENIEI